MVDKDSDVERGRELASRIIADPRCYRRMSDEEKELVQVYNQFREQERQKAIQRNWDDSRPVVEDLRRAGFEGIQWCKDILRNPAWVKEDVYLKAVPVLLKWLPVMENLDIKETIVRCLTVRWASPCALRPLLDLFVTTESETRRQRDFKWAVGQAVSILMNKGVVDEILAIAQDTRHGHTRGRILEGLWRMKDERAVEILCKVLEAEPEYKESNYVKWSAMHSLRMMALPATRPLIEKFADHPDRELRNEAKKALEKIDKAVAKLKSRGKVSVVPRKPKPSPRRRSK